ncbi:GntR family transcriptional regulator [Rhizobium mongolense]|uniref:GntR family transcriptional regulator n=1 Tax=Rhizobium mongolense TaxID=57676 RepID=UPI00048D3578|nr:GntR family transcriptional regulator [Rhizobium mongolense]
MRCCGRARADIAALPQSKAIIARKSVSAQVANDIIEYVCKNRMMSGQHLPAQVLADTFKVSRAPVAAALSSLHHDGLVELEANRGYFLKRNWSLARSSGAAASGID